MAETISRRWPSLLSVLVLVGGPVMALATPTVFKSPGNLDIVNGSWTLAYEKAFDASFSIRDFAISTWAGIQYVGFHEGRPGVLVGQDGWLFSSEDFALYPDGDAQIATKLTLITSIAQQLARRNVTLVVALIPDKSRLYAAELGRYSRPPELADRYAAFGAALKANGIVAPDLLGPLLASTNQVQTFLRTDTHWTPAGADAVAVVLASTLAPMLSASPQSSFTTTDLEERAHHGDLLNFLPLGILAPLGPQPDHFRPTQTTKQDAGDLGLFDEIQIPVALVGTSYSANPLWNFAGAISQRSGAEVLNVAQEGKGPFLPMLEYLASDEFKSAPPTVVVWDIPERFLPVTYDLSDYSTLFPEGNS